MRISDWSSDVCSSDLKVKELAESALAEAGKGIALSETAKAAIDEALIAMNEVKGRLDEAEQKIARKGNDDEVSHKSAGYKVIEDEGVKTFMASTRFSPVCGSISAAPSPWPTSARRLNCSPLSLSISSDRQARVVISHAPHPGPTPPPRAATK